MPEPTSPTVTATAAVLAAAQRHGADLDTITGTGVGGRVSRNDVLAAAGQAQRAETPTDDLTADDHLFDQVWGQAPEQPEIDPVFAQVWGSSAEPEVDDEAFAQVFGN